MRSEIELVDEEGFPIMAVVTDLGRGARMVGFRTGSGPRGGVFRVGRTGVVSAHGRRIGGMWARLSRKAVQEVSGP